MKTIILLGGPGAGKDTLANQISRRDDYMLSTGQVFRDQAEAGTKLGLEARDKYWGSGNLCPDGMVNELVKDTLDNLHKDINCIIFNGYPRSLSQAEYLNDMYSASLVLDLVVSEKIAIERLLGRSREDDTYDIIKTRFKDYVRNNKPLVDYYKSNNLYLKVDANQSIDAVYDFVKGILRR